jgi:hypothetical protein
LIGLFSKKRLGPPWHEAKCQGFLRSDRLLFPQKFGVRLVPVVRHIRIEVIIVKQFKQNPAATGIRIELQMVSTILSYYFDFELVVVNSSPKIIHRYPGEVGSGRDDCKLGHETPLARVGLPKCIRIGNRNSF